MGKHPFTPDRVLKTEQSFKKYHAQVLISEIIKYFRKYMKSAAITQTYIYIHVHTLTLTHLFV